MRRPPKPLPLSLYLVLQALCGAVGGVLTAAILLAIAVPSFSSLALPREMLSDLERLARLGRIAARVQPLGWILGLGVAALSWSLAARQLNPALALPPFRKAARPVASWLVFLGSGALLAAGLVALSSPAGGPFPWLGAAGCCLAWILVSPQGWAHRLARDARPDLLRAAFSGLAFAAGAFGAIRLGDRAFTFLYALNIDVWTRSLEVTYGGALRATTIVVALGAGLWALTASWAAALAADGCPARELARRAIVPAALAVALGAILEMFHHDAVARHAWRGGGLARDAGLSPAPSPLAAWVTLGFDKGPKAFLRPWPLSARYSGFSAEGEVPASEENAAALLSYIDGSGKESRYRNAALWVLPALYTTLLDPEGSQRALERLGPAGQGSLLWQMARLAWLAQYSPVTEANRARLAALSDEREYSVQGRGALRLAQGWRRFGDLERARRWLDVARASGVGEEDLKQVDLSPRKILMKGTIRGSVSLPDLPPKSQVRVALLGVGAADKEVSVPGRGGIMPRLVDAQWAGPGGSFRFRDLSEGRYALVLLAPYAPAGSYPGWGPGKEVRASRNPGIIALTRRRPSFDAGRIRVALKL